VVTSLVQWLRTRRRAGRPAADDVEPVDASAR
jgi:hypothetical protein